MKEEALNYSTTNLFENSASDFGSWSGLTPSHDNLMFHQIILVASDVLVAGKYTLRLVVFEGEAQLEATVDTGLVIDMTGVNSYVLSFRGAIRGIHLEVDTALTAGETVSCVLTSSNSAFDKNITWDEITGPQPVPAHTHAHADTTGKTPNDHHNQVHDWNGGDHANMPSVFPPEDHLHPYPVVKEVLDAPDSLTIAVDYQLLVYDQFDVEGDLTLDGQLVVL